MMYFASENGSDTGFAKWLDACLPSCNDNDDPDHNNTVIAIGAGGGSVASAPSPDRLSSPWFVPAVGISI